MVESSTSSVLQGRVWGQGAAWERPKDRIPPQLFSHGLVLARNHAALVLHSDRTRCGDPGLLTLSPLSRAASSSPHRTALLQARPRLLLPVQSLVCLAAFGLALPLAISLFPQMSEVSEGRGSRAGQADVVRPLVNEHLFSADSFALGWVLGFEP